MQSYGLTLLLKGDADVIERYKGYHREAWPEVIARLKEIGISEMKIYLIGRRLFMYMEAVDGFVTFRSSTTCLVTASGTH